MRVSPSAPVSSSGDEGRRATAASRTADETGAAGGQGTAASASCAVHTTPAKATSARKRWLITEASVRQERMLVPLLGKYDETHNAFRSQAAFLVLRFAHGALCELAPVRLPL